MAAIDSILRRCSRHEVEVQNRFLLLKRIPSTVGTTIPLMEITCLPMRIEIPTVVNGFVYLLVSLKETTKTITFVGQTADSLLVELAKHNSGSHEAIITKQKHLRPWTLAAFAFNFAIDDLRVDLCNRLEEVTYFKYNYKTVLTEFQNRCQSGEFGPVTFCTCVR